MTRREQCRAAQKRYEQTAKGKATKARYQTGAINQRARARRIRIGAREVGYAKTIEQARQINAYIKARLEGYVAQQRLAAGTKTQSVPARAVRPETAVRENRL